MRKKANHEKFHLHFDIYTILINFLGAFNTVWRQRRQSRQSSQSMPKGVVKIAGFIVTITALHFSQCFTQYSLWYDRERISNGEIWLVLTGHLVHVNLPHYFMNVAFLLVLVAFSPPFVLSNFLIILTSVIAATGIFIYTLESQLVYYAGMSGALHGMAIVIAISLWGLDKMIAFAILLCIVLKVFIETYWPGYIFNSSDLVGIRVSTESHLWGTLSGFLVASIYYARLFLKRTSA